MRKEYHLTIEGIGKGDLFCQIWYMYKRMKGLDLWAEHPLASLILTHRLYIPFQGHVYHSSVGVCHHPSTPRKTVLQNICNLARKHAPHTW